MKAYTCYRLIAVADIVVNHEFSLFNVFFQSNYREMNGKAGIVGSIKSPNFKHLLFSKNSPPFL